MILPCGVSSAPNRPSPGRSSVDVGGDEAVEEVAGVLAADLDHAPVGKKRCFHKLNRLLLTFYVASSWGNAGAGYHMRNVRR